MSSQQGAIAMPNWCSNRVTVYGSQQEISAFKALVASPDSLFDFTRIVPPPPELEALGELYCSPRLEGHVLQSHYRFVNNVMVPAPDADAAFAALGIHSWADWYLTHWGTTKVAFDVELKDKDDRHMRLDYSFLTAWTAPLGIYRTLLERFAGK